METFFLESLDFDLDFDLFLFYLPRGIPAPLFLSQVQTLSSIIVQLIVSIKFTFLKASYTYFSVIF
jgi:hypothetical protein